MFWRQSRQYSGTLDCVLQRVVQCTHVVAGVSLDAKFLRIQASGRQHRGCIITQAVSTDFCS